MTEDILIVQDKEEPIQYITNTTMSSLYTYNLKEALCLPMRFNYLFVNSTLLPAKLTLL